MIDLEHTYHRWLSHCTSHGRTNTQDAALLTLAETLLAIAQPGEQAVVVHPVVKLNGQEIPVVPEPEPQPAAPVDEWGKLLEAYKKLKEGNES